MEPCCSIYYKPKIIPANAPLLQNIKECFSSLILIQNIVNAAAVIPTIKDDLRYLSHSISYSPHDWIIKEKSLATAGLIPRASVITGKATAPPPSLVMPG